MFYIEVKTRDSDNQTQTELSQISETKSIKSNYSLKKKSQKKFSAMSITSTEAYRTERNNHIQLSIPEEDDQEVKNIASTRKFDEEFKKFKEKTRLKIKNSLCKNSNLLDPEMKKEVNQEETTQTNGNEYNTNISQYLLLI